MTTIGNNTAFQKLREYEKRASGFTPGSKKGGGPSDEWSGVVFGMGEARLACRINRVGEILPCPPSTPVPGAKPWILGLANVRGELLTIVDLSWYLSGSRTPITAESRLLSSTLNKAPIGLLVDEVYGQRHFLDSDAVAADLSDDSPLASVVEKRHELGSERWHELDLDRLFTQPEFLNGAADQ